MVSDEWFRQLFHEDYIKVDWHDDTAAEVDAIIDLLELEEGCRILDCCCGYGRHTIPLVERGYRVTGIDLSLTMLQKAARDARAKGVCLDLVQADARALPFAAEFDVVLNLFTAFGYFQHEGDNLRVLRETARVLSPGGRFLLDTVHHDFLVRHFSPQSWHVHEGVLLLEERRFDPIESRIEGIWTIVNPDGSRRSYLHSIRAYTFAELRLLLAVVGLDVVQIYGGYDRQALDWDASRMLIISHKGDR